MRRILCLALFAVLAAVHHASAASILFNGNLDLTSASVVVDNAPAGPGPEDFRLPKPLGWINEGFLAIAGPYEGELSSEPWAGPAPTPVTNDGVANGPHPDGCGGPDCGVFFKPFSGSVANGAATGHLYQDNPATPGLLYTLTGWAGAEANALMAGAEFAIEFRGAGGGLISAVILNLLPTLFVDNGEPFDYKQYTLNGIAPAGTAFVRVRASMIGGMLNPQGGGQAFVVDDFELTDGLATVPEPVSGALLGIGALAFAVRRRYKN